MLRYELLDIVNSGRAWAFVGSGVSIESGAPSWSELLEAVVSSVPGDAEEAIREDGRFKKALLNGDLPRAFSRVAKILEGREHIDQVIADYLSRARTPLALHREIADWPFRGYITTNYDGLIEEALRQSNQIGWTTVGNTTSELRKVAGDPDRVVWHVHGATGLDSSKSMLVVTEEDYDEIYSEDTPLLNHMRGLISQNRLVFIGFGLSDPSFMRLLHRIGRFANPARPILAFSSVEDPADREELFERYNVDVIGYRVVRGSHRFLTDLSKAYGGMVVRRSLRFGQPAAAAPTHDPETTGILIYNEFLLREHPVHGTDAVDALMRSRILALVSRGDVQTVEELIEDIDARARLIQDTPAASDAQRQRAVEILDQLKDDGVVVVDENAGLSLSPEGVALVDEKAGTAERLRDQFAASLRDRALELMAEPGASRVADAANGFLSECIERRALGVALTSWNMQPAHRRYQMVGLLQELPRFLDQVEDETEAVALTRLVQDVLGDPSEPETRFIGLALQAQFGVHLLGVDPDALRARLESVTRTGYVIDSNILIDYLARSSVGYASARLLIDRLREVGAFVTTTPLICREVAEHAGWALSQTDGTGSLQPAALRSITGRAGDPLNSFLDGFVEEVSRGSYALTDLGEYVADALGLASTKTKA